VKAEEVNNNANTVVNTVQENGISYKIINYSESGINYVTVTSDANSDVYKISYNTNNGDLIETINNSTVLNFNENDMTTNLLNSDDHDWCSKVYDDWSNDYFYQNKTNYSYYQIGCKASYLIKNTGSAAYALNNYVNAIDYCNSYFDKALGRLAGTGISYAVILNLVAVNIAFPETTIVSIVIGAVSGISVDLAKDVVSNFIHSHSYYEDVRTYYNIAKAYGTQL
jgi:hypothetical protein